MNEKYCPHCGNSVSIGMNGVCDHCGRDLFHTELLTERQLRNNRRVPANVIHIAGCALIAIPVLCLFTAAYTVIDHNWVAMFGLAAVCSFVSAAIAFVLFLASQFTHGFIAASAFDRLTERLMVIGSGCAFWPLLSFILYVL